MAKTNRNSRAKRKVTKPTVQQRFSWYAVGGVAVGAAVMGLGGWMVLSDAANADAAPAIVENSPEQAVFLPVNKVIVEGEFRHADLKQLQDRISSQAGSGFFNVDVTAIENVAREVDWIRSVSVRRVWPDTLKVYITEHQAYAAWNDKGLINKQGELFTPADKNAAASLPLLKGPEGTHETLLAQYHHLAPVMAQLGFDISVLEMDERFAWHVVLDNGARLLFGREQVDEAVKRFVDVFGGQFARNLNDVKQVDLRYTNGFAIKWNSKKVMSGNNKAGAWRGNS